MNFENVLLVHSLKCVLPVNLYDTTGESDLHINKELMKKLSLLSGKKCKWQCHSSVIHHQSVCLYVRL